MKRIITVVFYFLVVQIAIAYAQSNVITKMDSIYKMYQNNTSSPLSQTKIVKEGFYKKHISAQISANCEFKTTCSGFMKEAILQFGTVNGFLLGIDRLTRCGVSQNTYRYMPSLIDSKNYLLIDEMHHHE